MGLITDIREQKRRGNRVSIFVDGRFALGMNRIVALQAGLEIGQQVTQERLMELDAEAALEEAMSASLRYLAVRPRSERELKVRLRRRRFDDGTIDHTIVRLRERGLLDDMTFAQFWVEQRVTFRPRSRRLLEQELRLKGVDRETIDQAVADLDDEAEAYRAGQKRARTIPRDEYSAFYKKLVDHLRRKGFGYSTASKTANGLWSELETMDSS